MYILSPPPHLPWGPHPAHNSTAVCRVAAALNNRLSSTIAEPALIKPSSLMGVSGTIIAPVAEPALSAHSAGTVAPMTPEPILNSSSSTSVDRQLVSAAGRRNTALDPALRSTWSHRAWVAAGSVSVLTALANSVIAAVESGSVIEPALAAVLGYVLSDLGTGIYHFAVDNYGGPSTPIFGSQIEAFQGHHRRPATIARRQPANNLHALAQSVAFAVIPLELAVGSGVGGVDGSLAAVHAFIGVCAGCVMLSQQFHAWAHGTKRRVPKWVQVLQGAGVLISRDAHGAHHRVPYNNNYCIVSGVWNWVLDEHRVFETVEMVVFFRFGIRPRSWGETSVDWREEDDMGA